MTNRLNKAYGAHMLKLCLNALYLGVLVALSIVLVCASSFWRFLTWGEIFWHLNTPFNGIDYQIVRTFLDLVWAPLVCVFTLFIYFVKMHNTKYVRRFNIICSVLFLCVVSWFIFVHQLNLSEVLFAKKSQFVDENFVDPRNVSISFKEKRNLIHIYVESLETAYSSVDGSNFFQNNHIPKLTKIAQQNINFSNDDALLNGAFHTESATYTASSIFAQNSGIPLLYQLHLRLTHRREKDFLPNVLMSYDILQDNGYRNYFVFGSDSEFAAKNLVLSSHGDVTVYDYEWFVKQGFEDKKLKQFWGAEDKKTFRAAQDLLLEVAQSQQPFSFSILTVDTHPFGWLSNDCRSLKFNTNQLGDLLEGYKLSTKKHLEFRNAFYEQVLECSDNKIAAFVDWVKQQDFYQNTTIIITGDHLVQNAFIDIKHKDERNNRKTYIAIINPSSYVDTTQTTMRQFNLFDVFPTLLASIGANILGDRLGLGTNLFSKQKTLVEQYSNEYINKELLLKSDLLINEVLN